ncbi:hypothetical protein V6N13_092089 [Hibiscus sabdariffa]
MAALTSSARLPLIGFTLFVLICCCYASSENRQVYIVYMGHLPKGEVSITSLHTSLLQEVVPSSVGSDVLVYSYHRSFNGFAAKLTTDEAETLRGKDGVVSVFLSQKMQLHTTRSWDFMGFSKKVLRSFIESDIIVGMLDTGIWPESQSFNDTNFGPIPKKWKGTCQSSANFTCNKKIIGAKYYRANGDFYPSDIKSPRDSEGHGTHTSSTAAGDLVSKASLYGIAQGTARGAVPSARIAVYKVCWADGCYYDDILAAFDDAIADGVDIISVSLGSIFTNDYFYDPIAIGAFHSMANGILTSNSAGNFGPDPATIVNFSPWSLSVAASTIDRKFVTKVKLGNGEIYEGTSINTFDLKEKMYPFITGGDALNHSQGPIPADSRFCYADSLNKTLVKGKIILCDYYTDSNAPIEVGAVGAVYQTADYKDHVFAYGLPLSNLNLDDGKKVFNYANGTENPTATIFKTQVEDQFAPFVVSFSSRGPNPITADLLKPDLTAPGVDILAAWSGIPPLTDTDGDTRIVPYNIVSGTSMSCPHATGAAAYVKSFHPTWSPAAIKSALMTTALPMSFENNVEAEFAYGAGHINPALAAQPGLIYDAGVTDYVEFLCGQGYTSTQMETITGNTSSCSKETNGTVWDLNYPSFALSTTPGNSVTRVFHRTVTNVGSAVSTYNAVVKSPPQLVIKVQPSVLCFKSLGQKLSFTVSVSAEVGNSIISGALIWDDGVHQVYIVYMGDLPKGDVSIQSLHVSILQDVVPSAASDVLLYSYRRSFNGFAAKLTTDEANKLRDKEGVVSVFLSQKKQLHTSRTWEFMGFNNKTKTSVIESDIIVGMIDSGVWPESESFNDTNLGPVPSKWKGSCQNLTNFTCNKKIIGARYYLSDAGETDPTDYLSPRDSDGHGTHTASTAAGGLVSHASLFGLAKGTVRGGVPSARIAVYKVCWANDCSDEDILAAFDDAIADGVDIISISLGGAFTSDYFYDSVAIGSFHAMKNGILTSNSAGNGGPRPASVLNLSPWSLSVAASTIDRKFFTKVKLGNGQIYEGATINTFDLKGEMYPLIYAGDAPNATLGAYSFFSRYCLPGSLNRTIVEGKIVFCEYIIGWDSDGVMQAGAAGAVIQDAENKDYQFSYPLPLSNVNMNDGRMILNYLNTTENPTATIFKTSQDNNQFAPFVVSFSSRGPNPVTADILKPDITAPGVDILAAWSESKTTSVSESLAIPMTQMNNIDGEFTYGAGHINPLQATDPGLVYDAGEIDYVKFLCGQGYTIKNIQLITGDSSSCSDETNGTVWDLNYPSFTLSSSPGKSITRVFHRTVTNVGPAVSTYQVVINAPPVLVIQVQPSVLSFEYVGQKQSFVVTVEAQLGNSMASGSLIWDDGVHKVKSPIVAYASLMQ